ncbi:polysaccharide lyase family 14 protein [Tilletiaria anomala UBC 951]|uniref:Polysaccharide lyase family 14 protein n=1 Tax=Tilletiaria anomala (strain ATCC 24038 / CBS 436.72 / UBC 951) TaxID=1037660 RepID=A0A066W1P7_TILAU|nr:polysaccharide lyase family 14 protein [Tilletiaria anomala UBC 951]KDN46473.1 polysaccharide lyase family 14 protein [Tilletiaria anomala UBC 951]
MDAKIWLNSHVNLYRAQIASGSGDIDFAADPASSTSDAALRIFYSKGSYSLKSSPIGGASFYSQPFLSTNLELLVSYSVYFPPGFDFVQAGKLPGIYSSVGSQQADGSIDANTDGCSGGAQGEAGASCWSVRVMWRTGGVGEIYAYIPTKISGGYDLCANAQTSTQPVSPGSIICNSDYGTSIGRGSFSLTRGQWNQIALYVQVNSPHTANGVLQMYYNGNPTPAVEKTGLVFRSGTTATQRTGQGGGSGNSRSRRGLERRDLWDQGSQKWVDKIFFSTFFGGSTPDYAATADTYSYFKDFSIFAGQSFSQQSGQHFNAASSLSRPAALSLLICTTVLASTAVLV